MPTKDDAGANRLTPQQLVAIDLLVTGANVTEAARSVGVSRQTVSGWLNHDKEFDAELGDRRRELRSVYVDRLRAAAHEAIDCLRNLMVDAVDRSVRLRAATACLDAVIKAERGSCPRCDQLPMDEQQARLKLARLLGCTPAEIP